MAKPRHDEQDLARFAVAQVRANGGVLEHPSGSILWADQGLPPAGERDQYGGWTLPICQNWFGHRATKRTWLYIVGIAPTKIPPLAYALGEGTHVISQDGRRRDGTRLPKGHPAKRPECTKPEREHTPLPLAEWLVDLARRCEVEPV